MSNSSRDDKQDEDLELDLDLGDLDLEIEEPAGSAGSAPPPAEGASPGDGAFEVVAGEESGERESVTDDAGAGSATATGPSADEADADADPGSPEDGMPDAGSSEVGRTDADAGAAIAGASTVSEAVATGGAGAAHGDVAHAGATAGTGEIAGQWVWQFAAPPPPPSFSAVFFSGNALKELYRFFACGVLVALGTLLPWRAEVAGVEGTVPGLTLPMGAVTMAVSLWLVWASCSAIYSRKQKILPVFLMLVPFEVSLMRVLGAWDAADASLPLMEQLNAVLYQMGSGVLLVFVGSTIVSVQFVLTLVKIFGKKGGKGDRPARERKGGADAGATGRSRAERPAKVEKPAKAEKAAKADKTAKLEKRGRAGKRGRGDDKGAAAESDGGGRAVKGKRRGRRR